MRFSILKISNVDTISVELKISLREKKVFKMKNLIIINESIIVFTAADLT